VRLDVTARRSGGVEGTIVGVLASWQDVTAEKAMEVEIKNAIIEMQLFIDAAGVFIFCIDHDGVVVQWNNRATEISLFTREEVVGCVFHAFITDAYKGAMKQV
jgi:PAS domain-containing protein